MKSTFPTLFALAVFTAAPDFSAAKGAAPAPTSVATTQPTKINTPEAKKEEAKSEGLTKTAAIAGAKAESVTKTAVVAANHKSNGLATTLAFIPGIAVHGAGHMYAGSWVKGLGLFAIEGASIGIGLSEYNGLSDSIGTLMNNKNNQIPTTLGDSYGRAAVILVCAAGFVFSWFDDMAGASLAVDAYNKKADAAAQMGFHLAPQSEGAVLVYQRTF